MGSKNTRKSGRGYLNSVAELAYSRHVTYTEENPPKLFDNGISDLLSAKELADRLNLKETTIRKWRYEGYIPRTCMVKVGKRLVKYRWSEVERWLNDEGNQH